MRVQALAGLIVVLVCGFTRSATAEPPAPRDDFGSFAFAVNAPTSWIGYAYAASGYLGLRRHHAVRGNFALYRGSLALALPTGLRGSSWDGLEGRAVNGLIVDGGLAWVWYPRRLWDGFNFEAGALVRDRDTVHAPEHQDETETDTTTVGGRAMIGWSWISKPGLFFSIAVGLSVGLELGNETITPDNRDEMTTTSSVARLQVDGEGYLRIGVAFGR